VVDLSEEIQEVTAVEGDLQLLEDPVWSSISVLASTLSSERALKSTASERKVMRISWLMVVIIRMASSISLRGSSMRYLREEGMIRS